MPSGTGSGGGAATPTGAGTVTLGSATGAAAACETNVAETTRRTLIGWWRGDLTFRQALEAGLVLEGRRDLALAFPGWFERYLFAAIAPAPQA